MRLTICVLSVLSVCHWTNNYCSLPWRRPHLPFLAFLSGLEFFVVMTFVPQQPPLSLLELKMIATLSKCHYYKMISTNNRNNIE